MPKYLRERAEDCKDGVDFYYCRSPNFEKAKPKVIGYFASPITHEREGMRRPRAETHQAPKLATAAGMLVVDVCRARRVRQAARRSRRSEAKG